MNFDLQTVTSCVTGLARKLIPGWVVTVELAPSIEANQGALAMVYSTPERQMAHVVVAPHPPGESLEESIAHELTHSVLSPLTKLIEWSPAAVMIEEQIVERLGKIIATAPAAMARAVAKALQNPRTNSAAIRKRISALATRQRNEGKKRMDYAMFIAALEAALEAEDPKTAIQSLLEKVKGMQGEGGPPSAPAREDKPQDGEAPAMREDEMPPPMRKMARQMQQGMAMLLRDAIRSRLHTARTVDGIVLDAETEKDLAACATIEQFEREFKLVTRSRIAANEAQRKRSGVLPDESKDKTAGVSAEALTKEGFDSSFIGLYQTMHAQNKDSADKMLETARRARVAAPVPWTVSKDGGAK